MSNIPIRLSWERRSPRVAAILAYAATLLLTLLFFFSLYGLWGQSLHVPIVPPIGDYTASALFAKTAMQTGWCGTNSHLGAPHGFECYDFPMADGLNYGFFAVFGRFSDDVMLGMNLHYILGYLLISLTSLFAFRQFGFSALPSISASLLFAYLPYHYVRSEYHLFLSAYYLIPLIILVIFWIYREDRLLERTAGSRWRFRLTKKGLASGIICVLMGSGGVYYAAFALMFLLTIAVLLVLRTASPASLILPALAGFLIVFAVLVNLSPNLWFFHIEGEDQAVAHRYPEEAETYGLKVTNLLFPIVNHRLRTLGKIKSKYIAAVGHAGEGTEALGLAGGLGFLILIVSLFKGWSREPPGILNLFSRLNIAALLASTVGGFGSLFNFLVFPEIRVYSRMSVYIAFFSLSAVLCALRLTELRLTATWHKQLLFNIAAAGILFAGLWDLTPDLRIYRATARTYQSDQAFVQRIEGMMPGGAMIYQLPYMPYPEHGPLKQMSDYDPARGYLYSRNLRWSYGATEGRPAADWQQHEADLPPQDLLQSLKLIGFAGIWIDRFGYADRAAALSGQIKDLLNIEPLRSSDGRILFFPITGYQPSDTSNITPEKRKRLRDAAIDLPTQVSFTHCSVLERQGGVNWHWCGQDGEIEIRNLNSETAIYEMKMTLQTTYPQLSNFHFRGDFGSWDMLADINGTPLARSLKLSPGLHTIRIESDAPRVIAPSDPRDMHFQIVNFQLTQQ